MPADNLPENPVQSIGGSTADPFDIDALRLSQDFGTELGVERVFTHIPVRKPHRQDFFMVRPEEAYRLDLAVVELAEDRETYLLAPNCRAELFSEAVAVRLFTGITRQGTLFLWPCKLPAPDGRRNEWRTSALQAAEMATSRWVRIAADMGLGAYQIFKGAADLSEPTWPSLSFQELLRLAFRDRMIDRADHPVLKRLQGLI